MTACDSVRGQGHVKEFVHVLPDHHVSVDEDEALQGEGVSVCEGREGRRDVTGIMRLSKRQQVRHSENTMAEVLRAEFPPRQPRPEPGPAGASTRPLVRE